MIEAVRLFRAPSAIALVGKPPVAHLNNPASRVFALLLITVQVSAAEPQPNPDVTFHAPPKPLAAGVVTHDWTCFLGPARNATSAETKLQKKFPASGPALVWEMKRGTGYASPAIQGERLVYIHRVADKEIVECLHPENGKRYWQFAYATDYQDRYGYNNGPRASPVISGEFVFTYSAQAKLHCLKLATGEVVWSRDLAKDYKLRQEYFGCGTTPLVEGEMLIINVGAPKGTVIALEKTTGKELWTTGDCDWGASYATPLLVDIHGKRRVLVFAGGESRPPSGGLLCIDPANGRLDFRFPFRSASVESVNASTPILIGDTVFISASYDTGGALIRIKPDFTHEKVWTTDEMGTHFSTCIHKDGCIYGFDGRHQQNAQLACIDIKTGTSLWRKTLTINADAESKHARGVGRAALLEADGAFLCLGETGELLWLELSRDGCKELAQASLFYAPETWCLPVLSRGLLYIMQNAKSKNGQPPRLLCYDLRAE